VTCTNGLSSLAVSSGRVYTQIRRTLGGNAREVCVALDAATGDELWAADIGPAVYDSGVGNDDGPRSTPTVTEGRVFVLSSYLVLCCLNPSNGASLWRKDLVTLYGARVIGWQNAASPLLADGLLFVNCGSTSQSLLALRATDGSLAWRSQTEAMTQSTPVTTTMNGVQQVIFAAQSGLVSLNCTNGASLWRAPYPFSYSTSLAASPLVSTNIVFISANYSMGSFAVRISESGETWNATPIWTNSSYKAHWMSSVCRNGHIYGLFGSSTTASLKCIDIQNGAQKWSVNGFGRGGLLVVGGVLMVLAEKGHLVLVSAEPTGYEELSRWTAFPYYDPDANKCWNVPAICDGRVYARSTAQAVCLDIAILPLRIFSPSFAGNTLRLRVGTADGSALDANRMAALQLRSGSDLSAPPSTWDVLADALSLTNGVAEASLPVGGSAQRFYIVTEAP